MTHDTSNDGNAVGARRGFLSGATLAAATAFVAQAGFSGIARAADDKPMLMFVQVSEGLKVDEAAKTIRLVNVSPHTLYFADRPDRIAGHVRMAAYMEEWTSKAGADNFSKDPPNAALSIYEEGKPGNAVAVIEILDPKVEGKDLVYGYKLIDGTLPSSGGETALFIDWIGVGGGVGVGFHGVGVGVRGPGVFR